MYRKRYVKYVSVKGRSSDPFLVGLKLERWKNGDVYK